MKPASQEPITRQVTIVNRLGLHARAAAKFVRLANRFDAEVTVLKNGMEAAGDSILDLMMLHAPIDTELELRASGPAAADAIAALARLVADKFGEEKDPVDG